MSDSLTILQSFQFCTQKVYKALVVWLVKQVQYGD